MASDENAPGAQGGNPADNTGGAQPPQGDEGASYAPQGDQPSYAPQGDQASYAPQGGQYTPQGQPDANTQQPQGQYTPQGQQAPQGQYAAQGQYSPQGQYTPQGQYAPQGGAYPAGGYGAAAPAAPNPNKKKIILISSIAGAVVVLLIIATVVINVINGSTYGPQAVVEKYLTTISAGNAKEANSLVKTGVKKEKAALLNNKILKEKSSRISDPKVTKTATEGDSARVAFSYKLDGTTYDGTLTLSNQGKQAVFFDDWKIDKPLLVDVSVYISQGTEATVNGVNVDFGEQGTLQAYPGVYKIGAPDSKWFEAEDQTVVAATGSKAGYQPAELNLAPTDALTEEVQNQLNAMIDKCAKETSKEVDENCDMDVTYVIGMSEVTKVERKVVEYPTVTVDDSGRSFETEGGEIKYTVTGKDYSGEKVTGDLEPRTYWSFYGDITIDGDKVVIEYW